MNLQYILEENEKKVLMDWMQCEESLVGKEQRFCFHGLFYSIFCFFNLQKNKRKIYVRDYEVKSFRKSQFLSPMLEKATKNKQKL